MVYGHHESNDKSRLWGELLDMKSSLEVPIILNEIRNPHERKGCIAMSRCMEEFNN